MRHHSVGRRRWLRHPLIDERDVGGVVRAMLPVKKQRRNRMSRSPMRASRLTTSGDAINVGIGEKRPGTQVQVGVGSGGIAVTADPAHPVTPPGGCATWHRPGSVHG